MSTQKHRPAPATKQKNLWIASAVDVILDICTERKIRPTTLSTQVFSKKGRTYLSKLKEGSRQRLDLSEIAAFADALQLPFLDFMALIEARYQENAKEARKITASKQAVLHAAHDLSAGHISKKTVTGLLTAFQNLLPESLRDDEALRQAFAAAEAEAKDLVDEAV